MVIVAFTLGEFGSSSIDFVSWFASCSFLVIIEENMLICHGVLFAMFSEVLTAGLTTELTMDLTR